MTTSSWFIQVVQVSNWHTQQKILELCKSLTGTIALGTSNGDEHFVVIEGRDLSWQNALERPVADLDPGARLAQTCGPSSTSLLSEVELALRTRSALPDAEPGPERRD